MKDSSSGAEQPTDLAIASTAQGTSGGGELQAGTLVGEYRIERQLGRGGMGTVYAARHPVIGKRVAIKVLAAELCNDPALVRRFVDEARAVNKIGHPNIIDIFAFGQLGPPDRPQQYFVMDYLEGETLAARLARSPPIAHDEARRLLVQTADALEAAHRERIIHRDLKPENLWIARPKHGESFVKVLDFGVAKLLELTAGQNVTVTGTVIGTPYFMAPEQCLGQSVDQRADIYSLGVVLYEVFTGKLPFAGKTFAEIVAQKVAAPPPRPGQLRPLPAALDDLIVACLKIDPAQRPQSAAEVARRLEHALSLSLPAPRRRSRAVITVIVVAAVVAASAVVISRRSANRPPVAPVVESPSSPAPAPEPPRPAVRAPAPAATPDLTGVSATPQPPPPPPRPAPAPRRASDKAPAPAPSRVDRQGLIKENPFEQ